MLLDHPLRSPVSAHDAAIASAVLPAPFDDAPACVPLMLRATGEAVSAVGRSEACQRTLIGLVAAGKDCDALRVQRQLHALLEAAEALHLDAGQRHVRHLRRGPALVLRGALCKHALRRRLHGVQRRRGFVPARRGACHGGRGRAGRLCGVASVAAQLRAPVVEERREHGRGSEVLAGVRRIRDGEELRLVKVQLDVRACSAPRSPRRGGVLCGTRRASL